MKIKTTFVVILGVAFFVLLSVGALSPKREVQIASVACPYPNYPCGSLPQGFKGWPTLR